MIWSLIGSIGGKVLHIVDDVVEDKDEANRLKFEIQRQLIENKPRQAPIPVGPKALPAYKYWPFFKTAP